MNYIKEIKINHLRYLDGVDIKISDDKPMNLILTGRNGSGKTTLLDAIFEFLKNVSQGKYNNRKTINNIIVTSKKLLENAQIKGNSDQIKQYQEQIKTYSKRWDDLWNILDIRLLDLDALYYKIQKKEFIVAYYKDDRNPRFVEPQSPVKPDYNVNDIGLNKISQFLNMLVDYKVQAALARNEGEDKDADNINGWFDDFEGILKKLFEDANLKLEFNYTNYAFTIKTKGKEFKFTQMSAGYRAAMDIVADLVFKMQQQGKVVRAYDMEGIVLIDEIETHLHLELQRQILPLLASFFPNVQFIVSTHSPFVLSSLKNSVAFDLENRKAIPDLTDYSYSTLVEGYFGVKLESSDLDMRLDKMEELAHKDSLSLDEKDELHGLMVDFDKMPEAAAPLAKGRFLSLKTEILTKEAAK